MTTKQDLAALERLVDDARKASPPEIDWPAAEAALLERVARDEQTRSGRPSRIHLLVWAAAAGLALAGGASLWRTSGEPVAKRVPAAHPEIVAALPQVQSGDALAVGVTLAADAVPVVVEHRGHARWTLEPRGRAHLESRGEVVTVVLDEGALVAEVTPSSRPESFAVRVERARAAVHGTRFRVERLGDRVRVEVREGVVAVGPVGAAGVEVHAPSSTTVTLEGLRPEQPAGIAAEIARPATPAHPPSLAQEPAAGVPKHDPAPSVSRIVDGLQRCLREQTGARGDLHVTVRTRMSLRVSMTGKVEEARFDPPLSPAVGRCVDGEIAGVAMPRSAGGFVVDRDLVLER